MGFQIELDLRNHNKMLLEENEQLQAKVAELEEEIKRSRTDNIAFARNLKGKSATTGATYEHICTKLAAEQLNNKRLRDALQEYIDEHEECQDADDWMAMMCSVEAHHAADEAISQPSDTSALDSFVAEKVKELDEANEHHRQLARVSRDNELKATKQRDLAVEALEKWDMFFGGDAETAVLTIAEDPSTLTGCQKATKEAMSTIKESEGKLCAH